MGDNELQVITEEEFARRNLATPCNQSLAEYETKKGMHFPQRFSSLSKIS